MANLTVPAAKIRQGPVYLRFDDGKVFVAPEDYNIFMIEARRAIEALRSAVEVDGWVKSFFDEYVPYLHEWCQKREDLVEACYFAFSSGQKVFIVTKGGYNVQLGEEISKLELDLANMEWSCDVLQIPDGDDEELQTFFNPDRAVQIYAQPKTAPTKS